MNKMIQSAARTRVKKAIDLLADVAEILGDADDLERALAGQTTGMVDSDGDAKEGTFRIHEARAKLKRALDAVKVIR